MNVNKKVTYSIFIVLILLISASCAPKEKEEEVLQSSDEQEEQEISIVPSYQLSKKNYRMILPFRPSEARGVITGQIKNRLDIDEMEDALRRHSTEAFDPEKYYYEEGQYLDEKMVKKLIDDLNPDRPSPDAKKKEHEENPRILSHILEQNYLNKTENNSLELVGVSIGIALKSVYEFEAEGKGPYFHDIPKSELLSKGNEIAEDVLAELREIEELADVPIMIALYREEEESSPIPGNFVAKTLVEGAGQSLGKWETIEEKYVLFPSDKAKDDYFDDYEVVNEFGKKISTYFPNYVGVIGKGFYLHDELKTLSLEVPIEFYGSAEVVGFSQYVYGLVLEMFPEHYDLEIKITSSDQVESIIYREAGEEEPTVHVFH